MTPQRREKILAILREKGEVTLHELEESFPDLSSMTLRRDLEFFENIGEAVRIRGGARYVKSASDNLEDIYALREIKNRQAKEHIAAIASRFAEPGRSIFIDSGTTAMCLAKSLPDTNLSILTGGPNVAVEVSQKFKPSVTLLGGLVNRATLSVSGAQSNEFIGSVNIDIAFLVASAFSCEGGFTCGNLSECELKHNIVCKAHRKIVLADSDKIGKSMPFTFARMEDIDILITECAPPDEILEAAKKKGVEILW